MSTAPSTPDPQPHGLRALVIETTGAARLVELPLGPVQAAHRVGELVGGHLEAIITEGSDWLAYINEEGIRLGLPFNPQADAIARALGYGFMHGDYLKGPAVYLGRDGLQELDVPDSVMVLAWAAGIVVQPATTEAG